MASPLDITKPGRLRELLRSTTCRWPGLRATATVGPDSGSGVENGTNILSHSSSALDCSIIPRAMQAEEDLCRIIDDYQSLVFAGSLM